MLSGTVIILLVKLLSVGRVNERNGDKPILSFYKQHTFTTQNFCQIMVACFARLIMSI